VYSIVLVQNEGKSRKFDYESWGFGFFGLLSFSCFNVFVVVSYWYREAMRQRLVVRLVVRKKRGYFSNLI
jgi:hypothetical protein